MPAESTRGEAWFTALYAAHHLDVVRYHARRIGDADEAGELAQEVFAVAWRRRADVPERELPWLYGVARRVLANRLRAERSRPALVPLEHSEHSEHSQHSEHSEHSRPGQHAGVDERVGDVLTALAGLPRADRELLCLIGWEDLTPAEAAVVLGVSRATVAVRLHRARRRLAGALAARPAPAAYHHQQAR
jgi:RNA polymerase sigma-70 factor (ECF subfamily)